MAKKKGRPRKGKRVREVYSVRLAPELVQQAKQLAVDGNLTTAVEYALKLWIDEHSPSNQ